MKIDEKDHNVFFIIIQLFLTARPNEAGGKGRGCIYIRRAYKIERMLLM